MLRERVTTRLREAREMARTGRGRHALRRQYAFETVGRLAPVIGVETDDGLIFVSTQDKTVGRSVYAEGQWDASGLSAALDVAAQHGHPGLAGRTFVEVGANIGTTTLQAAKIASHCIAIEPAPDNLRLLRANVAANGYSDQVTIIPAAASDHAGTMRLALDAKNHGDHRVSEVGDVEVQVVRLDDVLAGVADVGLLWLDTQGHEARVLAGAPRMLESPPLTVTEYWPSVLGEDRAALDNLLGHWSGIVDLSRPGYGLVRVDQLGDELTDLLLLP